MIDHCTHGSFFNCPSQPHHNTDGHAWVVVVFCDVTLGYFTLIEWVQFSFQTHIFHMILCNVISLDILFEKIKIQISEPLHYTSKNVIIAFSHCYPSVVVVHLSILKFHWLYSQRSSWQDVAVSWFDESVSIRRQSFVTVPKCVNEYM